MKLNGVWRAHGFTFLFRVERWNMDEDPYELRIYVLFWEFNFSVKNNRPIDHEQRLMREAFDNLPDEANIFANRLCDISDKVEIILKEKEWSMDVFASKMDMTLEDLTKWFTTPYNMTLKNISKMESVLGCELIEIF